MKKFVAIYLGSAAALAEWKATEIMPTDACVAFYD